MGLRQLIAVAILALATGVTAQAQLVPPGNFRIAILSPTALRLTWQDDSATEINYRIGYHAGITGAFGLFPNGTLAANTTTFDAIGLAPSATYQFFVEAVYQGNYHYSAPTVTVTMPDFQPPSNVTAVVTSPTAVNLRWSDGSTNEDGFFVGYRAGTNGNFTGFPGGTLLPNTTNFIANNLAPNTTYQFLIEAFVGNTAFADSAPITVTTPAFRPPSNLTAVATSPTTVNLTWSDNTTNESGFRLAFRLGTSTNNPFFLFPNSTVAPDTTNFAATGLLAGTTYQFFVEAFFGTNTFAPSPTVTVSTPNAISNRPFASGVVGQPFVFALGASTNGGAPDSFSVTGPLPPGVSFNGTNQITGTPSAGGAFNAVITAHYPAGTSLTNPLTVRVIHPPGPPIVINPNLTLLVSTNGLAQNFPLTDNFRDPDTDIAVRFTTSQGQFDVALYPAAAPQTVSNFLGYVDRGDYSNSLIHRAAPNFVVQGGGFTTAGTNFGLIPTQPSPTNEPGIQQSRGTIAMAKRDGDPNSATDQWFVNLRDNGDQLDDQNGGFTAFGRVLGTGMSVVDAIDNLPRTNYNINVSNGTNLIPTPFQNVPVDDVSAPVVLDPSKLVIVQSVTRIQPLTYSAISSGASGLVTAGISPDGTQLVVTPVTRFGGFAQISVTATDRDGNSTTTNFPVEIQSPYTTWLKTNSLSSLAALPGADPDGDGVPNAVEFALAGSPTNADASTIHAAVSFVPFMGQQYVALTFKLRKDPGGAIVRVQATDTLAAAAGWITIWDSDGVGSSQVVSQADQGDYWLITVRDTMTVSSSTPTRFLNLQVQVP